MSHNIHTVRFDIASIVKVLVVLLSAYVLFLVSDFLLVVLTAIVIASAVEPGARWFVRFKIPRVVGVLLIYIATAILFVGAFYFFLVPILFESTSFIASVPQYSQMLTTTATSTKPVSDMAFLEGVRSAVSIPRLLNEINAVLINISSGFFGTVDVIFGGIVSFFLIIVISFYLAVQEDGVGAVLRIVTPLKFERYVIDVWKRSREKIGLWMQGQLMLCVIVAVLTYLGLSLLGVEKALLLAFLAGLLEIIPLFGPILSAVPAVIVAFSQGGVTLSLMVAGLFLIVQQFESHLIYPLVVKKVVGVPPIVSIVALVIGGQLGGFLGIILSVPVATVFMELLSDYEKSKASERGV